MPPQPQHTYSVQRDPDGTLTIARERIGGAGVSVGQQVDSFQLAEGVAAGIFQNTQRFEAVCIATGTVAGQWFLQNGSNGTVPGTSIYTIQQPEAPVNAGKRIVIEFPTPLQTGDSAESNLHVRPSVSGMGTWFFHVNGYLTRAGQGGSTY